MKALAASGGRAWFVGGCVRDSLLDPKLDDPELDIDVTTDLLPDQVVQAVQDAGMKAIPTGIAHGTVTVVAAGRRFEVTTLRRDVATDGRHATVMFGSTIEDDAARRDFTINALYAEPGGRIVDPLGGLPDLAAGRVRFVGDPDRRILEDHLRILRFFRFHARFATGSPDEAGLAACVRHRELLRRLSAERVAKEFLKLLVAPGAVGCLVAMKDAGLLHSLDMSEAEPTGIASLRRLGVTPDAILCLGSLFHKQAPQPRLGSHLADRLKLSAAERDRLEAMLGEPLPKLDEPLPDLERRWYVEGVPRWLDRYFLGLALSGHPPTQFHLVIAQARAWKKPTLPVTGADVLAFNIPPGPLVGQCLRAVEEWWLGERMAPGRDACLAVLQTMLAPLTNHPGTP
jgi:tRNA nucleotidyltransferase/poly(A) polymerase